MLDFITERIAIGNAYDAVDPGQLEAYGIGGVLNVAIDLDLPVGGGFAPVEYQKTGLWDGGDNPPGALAAALLTLDAMLQRHRRVLVHCHAGISRSPTVVAAYLARRRRLPFWTALDLVLARRSIAGPHEALCRLAERLPSLDGLLVADAGEDL